MWWSPPWWLHRGETLRIIAAVSGWSGWLVLPTTVTDNSCHIYSDSTFALFSAIACKTMKNLLLSRSTARVYLSVTEMGPTIPTVIFASCWRSVVAIVLDSRRKEYSSRLELDSGRDLTPRLLLLLTKLTSRRNVAIDRTRMIDLGTSFSNSDHSFLRFYAKRNTSKRCSMVDSVLD